LDFNSVRRERQQSGSIRRLQVFNERFEGTVSSTTGRAPEKFMNLPIEMRRATITWIDAEIGDANNQCDRTESWRQY